jgi:hypothetical protein
VFIVFLIAIMLVVVAVLVIVDTILKGFLPVSLRVEESRTLVTLASLAVFIGPSAIPLMDEPVAPFVKVAVFVNNDFFLAFLNPFSIMAIVPSVALVLVISLGRPEPTVTPSPPPPAMFSIRLVHMRLGRFGCGRRSRRYRSRCSNGYNGCDRSGNRGNSCRFYSAEASEEGVSFIYESSLSDKVTWDTSRELILGKIQNRETGNRTESKRNGTRQLIVVKN